MMMMMMLMDGGGGGGGGGGIVNGPAASMAATGKAHTRRPKVTRKNKLYDGCPLFFDRGAWNICKSCNHKVERPENL